MKLNSDRVSSCDVCVYIELTATKVMTVYVLKTGSMSEKEVRITDLDQGYNR